MSPPAATIIHHPVEGERPGFAIRILVPLSGAPFPEIFSLFVLAWPAPAEKILVRGLWFHTKIGSRTDTDCRPPLAAV